MSTKHLLGLCLIIWLGTVSTSSAQSSGTLSGYVKDAETGEELIGVNVYVSSLGSGAVTNPYGFYSLTIPQGTYEVKFTYLGYESVTKDIDLTEEGTSINIELSPEVVGLEEVVISSTRLDENVRDISMSTVNLNLEQIKRLPSLFGEPDIIKSIQMQPGVISAGEGTSAYFVRGGSSDQNLIIIDEAPVYDASHLFGLFSVFNSDVIKSSELYKGGIPARYGGRLSSLLDVRTIDGNNKRFGMKGGIGTLASRLMLEGPIKKDKASYLISGRRSYVDVFQRLSNNEDVSSNLVYFYDINAKVNWKISNKNRLFAAGYFGRDNFNFGEDAGFDWGNTTFTLRWNHLFSDKLFSNTSVIFSNFDYGLELKDPVQGLQWTANLQQAQFKLDFSYFLNPKNNIEFGYQGAYLRFSPGRLEPNSPTSIFTELQLEKMFGLDHSLYISNDQDISDRLSFQYGLRLSYFQNIGPFTFRDYEDPQNNINPKYEEIEYDDLEVIEDFFNLEPRFAARYMLNANSSVKVSYNRMVQNVHLMSNSTVPVPFNTWQPSSPYLRPQKADQIAAGIFKNYRENTYELSIEAYYKWMYDVTDFADNAQVFLNQDIATEFRQGDSYSYGLEFFLVKNRGPLTGSFAYTYSKTMRQIPTVNNDLEFPANFDRRHSISIVGTYELNDKWAFGANWVYGSGRPLTVPAGRYEFDGYVTDIITERNGYRLPDYHRMDLSATLTPRKNKNRRWQGSWVFSIYNLYGRKNPFTIYTRLAADGDGNIFQPIRKEARMIYLFQFLPSVTYNFKF
ncbi:MAG TPA: TonB-dependent receptor [Cytophagales bacterium]|jgi:hypothetical protein|nr:TonB-dependent receptor [Cytophagales bacterium]